MNTLQGGCHCGNIKVELATALSPGEISLRTCLCTFCRKHGARYASDPRGTLTITVADTGLLHRYQFALGVTDFLVCRACGVYVAATTRGAPDVLGVVNVNVLEDQESLPRTAQPMVFDGESVEGRTARRVRGWTPVTMLGEPR